MKMVKCDNCGAVQERMMFTIANVTGQVRAKGVKTTIHGGMVLTYGDFCSRKCVSEWFAKWEERCKVEDGNA